MVGLARPMYGVPMFERRLDQARCLRQASPVVALSFLFRLVRSALDLLGVHRLSGLENTSRSSCSATRSKSGSDTRHAASSPGADRLGAFLVTGEAAAPWLMPNHVLSHDHPQEVRVP